jgi:hypothetical protein
MQRMASMMGGSREAESHTDYQPLPGGEFDDIGESQRAIDTANRLRSTPSRKIHLPRLEILFPDASVPSPRRLHLRRDSSAGLLAGQRRRRDPGERAEPRRQSHRVVPQVRLPAAHPARRADGGVRLLRSGHLPGRLRGARSPRSAARARTVHEDGQVPTLRRGAAAAPGGVAGCLRGVSPGDRHAWGGKRGWRRPAAGVGGELGGERAGRGGHAADHRVPVVQHEAAATAGGAAGGLRRVSASHASPRGGPVVRMHHRTTPRTRARITFTLAH